MTRIGLGTGLLATALLAVGCSAQDGSSAAGSAAAAVELAPDFELPALDGGTVRLSDFRGKTVILDFWATWCPPCVFQVPELNKLSAAHRDSGDLMVIGVSVDVDGAEVVGPWIEENGVEYKIVLGDVELAEKFGAMGFPTLVVISPEGGIDSLHVGLIEYDSLEEIVAATPDSRST